MKRQRPVDLRKVKTYPVLSRKSVVDLSSSAKPFERGGSFREFIEGLPDALAAKGLRDVVKAVAAARRNGRAVVLGMGAHPIKAGLSPVIIDLMEREIITAVASNGASIVHDFEMAYAGRTSEDVQEAVLTGRFGMAKETGERLNRAIRNGTRRGLGIGESVGGMIFRSRFKEKEKSIFGRGFALGVPCTVHVAIGTDIIHMHPGASGCAIGEGSMRDFRLFASVVAGLEGGVYINLGSAVIMPEVFLKALNVARNVGRKVEDITTVNMDFIQHYRPSENVLRRPTSPRGRSYALTGHHEIMLPLVAAAVIEEMG